jgi:hypothetical protein
MNLVGSMMGIGGVAVQDTMPLGYQRFLAPQTGADKFVVEARITGAGAGTVLRPVYVMADDPGANQIEDPANDRAITAPGNFIFEFDAVPGAKMGIRVVTFGGGGALNLLAAYGRTLAF